MTGVPLTGGYACVDNPGFVPGSIRLLTRSQYSHAFIVVDAVQGTTFEAFPDGAHYGNLGRYYDRPIIYSKDAVKATPEEITQACDKIKGTPYGFLDIAYLGMALSVGWKPQWLLERVLTEKRMICSQLVAYFGKQFGSNWTCGQPDPQLVTPGMLAARIDGEPSAVA